MIRGVHARWQCPGLNQYGQMSKADLLHKFKFSSTSSMQPNYAVAQNRNYMRDYM